MPTQSASATANITPGQEAIFESLLAAMRGEPTISELADQVRTLRAEVQTLREQQAPRSEIIAVGPEVTQLFFRRYATHGRSGL